MAEEGSDKEPAELGREETNCTNFPLEVQEPFNLQHLIDDDVFQALRKHFLMTGKGRRPDLPKNLVVTRGLLLQLYILKEESQESFKTLKVWLDKLAPELASVTEGRIKHRVTSIVESCKQMSQDVACQYLQAEHDFHALVGSLAGLGLNRQHLLEGYNLPEQLPVEMVNNHVVVSLEQFRAKEKQPAAFVVKWLKTLSKSCASLTDKQVKYKSSLVITKAKTLSKNEKDMEALELFLKRDFPQASVHQQTDDQCQLQCSECAILKQTIKKLESDYKLLETKVADLSLQNNIKDEICVDVKRLYQENSCLEASIKQHKNELKAVYEHKKSMKQELEKLKSSNMYRKNQEYKKSLEKLEDQKNHVMNELKQEQVKNSQLETNISTLKSKVKEEQNLKSYYKASFRKEKEKTSELNKMLTFDFENNIENIKIREDGSSHRYSDDVRKTFYALQGEANVPATNCSKVILTVAKHLFKTDLENKLPSSSSSLNFSNEAHVIAKSQIMSEIQNSDHFIFASDGTSRQKASFLEQHIVLSNGKQLSLGFSEVACEDSDTLLDKCISAFKEIIEVHCLDVEDKDENELLKEVITKMKGLLSDRAAVMKAFDEKMHQFKIDLLECDTASTHFLFCNAHFLLALSSASEAALRDIETEITTEQEKLGRDANTKFSIFSHHNECATLRAIRTAAEVLGPRCDEKSGCRQNWLAFCSSKGKKSFFTSYRSNRFNNLYQNSTAFLYHREDIVEFLTQFNTHDNQKLQSVLEDTNDKRVLANVAVLSFLHAFITEPYWNLMNSFKSYAEFPMYAKKLHAVLSDWENNAFDQTQSFVSVFEDFPSHDLPTAIITEFLQSSECLIDNFKNSLRKVCFECCAALKRQLCDFLDGGVFGGVLEENVYNVLKTCPLTNLTGERLFGDLDYCITVRRNASLFLRSTRNMWKRNKTVKFLSKQGEIESKKLLKKAIQYGHVYKRRSIEMKKKILEIRKAKGAEVRQKKHDKALKLLERKRAALDAVLARGGMTIITNKDELDAVFNGPQALQRLKEQIRFKNLVGGESIRITGNKRDLYERLLQHVAGPSSK